MIPISATAPAIIPIIAPVDIPPDDLLLTLVAPALLFEFELSVESGVVSVVSF